MITNAIQSLINPIVDSYASIIESDEFKQVACIHTEDVEEVLREKEKVYGYVYSVSLDVLAQSLIDIDNLSTALIAALSGIECTVEGTIIEETTLRSTTGPQWDDEAKTYINTLVFNFQTQNL